MMGEKIQSETLNEFEHCVVPLGKFYETDYFGKKRVIGYTEKELEEMYANWEQKTLHYEPILNVGHEDDKVGDIESLSLNLDDDTKQKGLWAHIVMDDDGVDFTQKHKYRYLSPEIYTDYIDGEGNSHGKVFAGVALTNYPRHKMMEKLRFSLDELKEMLNIDKGGESNKMVENFEEKYNEVVVEMNELKQKFSELEEKYSALLGEKHSAEVDAWKAKKLSDGFKPAVIESLSEKLVSEKIDFEMADEIIEMTEKVSTEQVSDAVKYTNEEKDISVEELGKLDNRKFERGE